MRFYVFKELPHVFKDRRIFQERRRVTRNASLRNLRNILDAFFHILLLSLSFAIFSSHQETSTVSTRNLYLE